MVRNAQFANPVLITRTSCLEVFVNKVFTSVYVALEIPKISLW